MTGGARKKVTLAAVAREAGLSPAAASLALRGEPGVSRETRDRVVDVARRLGYHGVVRTANRRSKQTTLGMVIKAPQGDAPEANRFYAPVMAGVEEMCRIRDVDLLFATMPVDAAYHPLETPRLITERSVDGLIVIGAHLSSSTTRLLEDGPPAMLVDAYAEDMAFDSVVSDNEGGARTAVDHLIARGHRRIALIGTAPDSFPSIFQRRRGYLGAMAEAELPPDVIDVPHVPPEVAAQSGLRYLREHPGITAAFCSNDDVAISLIQAATETGINVPGTLSVVGYDDIDLARFVSPQLTTLSVDKVNMGRLAVTLLMHRLEYPNGSALQTFLRPVLIERASVRTIRSRNLQPVPG